MATECRCIAIAVDGSEHAEHAFNWYLTNIRKDGDKLVLVHCPESYDLTLASPATVDQLLREMKQKIAILKEKYEKLMQEKGLTGKFYSDTGKPGEVIVKMANEHNAMMIITGTRGLGTIRRTLMGSVSDYVLHHSKVPVLVCRKKATDSADSGQKKQ